LKTTHDRIELVIFELSDSVFGMSILDVREIVEHPKMTIVQKAPPLVSGLVNLRGQIITALDLGVLFEIDTPSLNQQDWLVVFKHHDIAFTVDQVNDVILVTADQCIEVPVNIDPAIAVFIDRVVQKDDQLIMVISAQHILAHSPAVEDGHDIR
jgi:purine-binding chemotaxis protein CheW